MNKPLTSEDIEKIKREKRFGYMVCRIILCTLFVVDVVLLICNVHVLYLDLLLINSAIIGLAFLTRFLINHPYNKDLKAGVKCTTTGIVSKKHYATIRDINSQILYYIVFSLLLKKETYKAYIVEINKNNYETEKLIFDTINENDTVSIYHSLYGEVYLGIENIN